MLGKDFLKNQQFSQIDVYISIYPTDLFTLSPVGHTQAYNKTKKSLVTEFTQQSLLE